MILGNFHFINPPRLKGFLWSKLLKNPKFLCKYMSVLMDHRRKSTYEEAVYALNGLQSNSAYLEKARKERSANAHLNLLLMEKYLKTLGIEEEDINSLNAIHVAGTKGKGSTCAFSEVILHRHGFKTGFYSSPHVISVNERIRINGIALSKESFAKYFWEVYENISKTLDEAEQMPHYFLFLTLMAFYVFVKEQVQVAVVEVGIGGLYDCTNILRKPVVVGITTLGIDHVSILGSTISEIAAQKAGIFKKGVPAFTVPQQEPAMKVLRRKARTVECSLHLSPPLEAFDENIVLQAQGIVQNVNASLALQLTNAWLNHWELTSNKKDCSNLASYSTFNGSWENEEDCAPLQMAEVFPISVDTKSALRNCEFPGRFQTVEQKNGTFYLDSAHTQESIRHCVKWFQDACQRNSKEPKSIKVLMFNCTGDRKAENLLDPLADVPFDLAIFCPNRVNIMKDASSDLSNFMVDPQKEIQQCAINKEIWCHLLNSIHENELAIMSGNSYQALSKADNAIQFPSISSALNWISASKTMEAETELNELLNLVRHASHLDILVTGSLHLVGGVLSVLQS